MRERIADEKMDALMRSLLANTAIDEDGLKKIAESPNLWWAVQRKIAERKSSKSPWPPANILRRLLMFGIPAAAAAALIISLFAFRSTPVEQFSAIPNLDLAPRITTASIEPAITTAKTQDLITPEPGTTQHTIPRTSPRPAAQTRRPAKLAPQQVRAATPKTEIKTDFIALTYARDAESGQIVRVKVPSSMMVTLGVVANVEKPAHLVDAEVLVGDDGLTRAIRFVRSN